MANETGDAVFNEVVRISADSEQFIQDLQKIEEEWSQSLVRMAEAAKSAEGNPISTIAASSNSGIADLKATLDSLTTTLTTNFQALATAIGTSMEEVATHLQKVIDKETEVGKGAKDAAAAAADVGPSSAGSLAAGEIETGSKTNFGKLGPEDAEREFVKLQQIEEAANRVGSSTVKMYETLTGPQQKWFTRFADDFAKVEQISKETFDAVAASGMSADEKLVAQHNTAVQKLQEADERLYQIKKQQLETFGADFSAAEAKMRSLNFTEGGDDSTAMLQRQATAVNKLTADLIADFGKRLTAAKAEMNEELDATEKAEAAKLAVQTKYLGQWLQALSQRTVAEKNEAAKQVEAAEKAEIEKNEIRSKGIKARAGFEDQTPLQQAKDREGGGGQAVSVLEGFAGGLAKGSGLDEGLAGIAESVGAVVAQLTTWLVLFKAIQVVGGAIKEIFMALPNALERGLEFLSKMQEKAVDLQPVIAQSFRLSPDFQTNFDLAGKAAEQVVLQLRQRAVELNLDFEKVLVTFKDFASAGGGGLTHNIQESLDLTLLMERATKGMVSDQRESKTLQQEIPALLDGSVQASSKFLHELGLTRDQWLAILAASKEHQNLLEQLTPLLKNFAEAGDKIPNTFESLQKQFSLILDMFSGHIAEDTFKQLIEYAVQLREYLAQHKVELEAITTAIGGAVGGFLRIIATVVGLLEHTGVLKVLFGSILQQITSIAVELAATSDIIALQIRLVGDLLGIFTHITHPIDYIKEAWKDATKAIEDYKKQHDVLYGALAVVGTGQAPPAAPEDNLLTQNTAGSRLPANNNTSDATERAQKLSAALQDVKTKYEDMRVAAQAAADGQEKSVGQIAANAASIIKSLDDQLKAQNKIIDDYIFGLEHAVNISQELKDKGLEKATEDREKAQLDHDRAVAAAQRTARREELSATETAYRDEITLAERNTANQISLVNQAEAAHELSTKEGAARRTALLNEESAKVTEIVHRYTTEFKQLGATAKQFKPDQVDPETGINKNPDIANVKDKQNAEKLADIRKETAEAEREAQNKYHILIEAEKHFAAESLAIDRETHAEGLTNQTRYTEAVIAGREGLHNRLHDILVSELNDDKLGPVAHAKAIEQFKALEDQHAEDVIRDQQQLAAARKKDTNDQIEAQTSLKSSIAEAAQEEKIAQDKLSGNRAKENKDIITLIQIKYDLITAELLHAKAQLATIQLQQQANGATAEETKKTEELTQKIQDLTKAQQENADAIKARQGTVQPATGDTDKGDVTNVTKIADAIFGKEAVDKWRHASSAMEKVGAAAELASSGLQLITGIISDIKQGEEKGGTLGGIGAGVSDAGSVLSETGIPQLEVAGAVLKLGGQIVSMFGGIFKAAAAAIAEEVKKEFDVIVQKIRDNAETLGQGIKDLQAEKEEAITRLSNKKGGQDELAKLLPEFDKQINELKNQQRQIIDNFNDQVTILKQQTDVGQKWLSDWKEINQQVKQYLDAGGNPSTAAQFLNEKLASETLDLQNQYNDAEQAAIKDAFSLNDMLDQRIKLQESITKNADDQTKNLDDQRKIMDQIAKLSASENDSIVRRQAGAITAAQEYKDKKKALEDQLSSLKDQNEALKQQAVDNQKQLTDLNYSIDLQTIRVAKEKEVFGLTGDIASLHRLDEQLSLEALDQEVAKWKEMKSLIDNLKNGTTFDPSNLLGVTGPKASDFAAQISALKAADTKGLKDNSHNTTIPEIETTIGQFQTGFLSLTDTLAELKQEKADLVRTATDKNHRKALADVSPSLDALIAQLTKAAANAPTTPPANQPFPDAPGAVPGLTPSTPTATGGPATPTATANVLTQTLNTQLDALTTKVQTTSTQSTSALTTTLNTQLAAVSTAVTAGSSAIVVKLDQLYKLPATPVEGPSSTTQKIIDAIQQGYKLQHPGLTPAPVNIVVQAVHVASGVDPYVAGKQVGGGIVDEFNYRYRAGIY